jgi:hypothetical protein
VPILATGMPSRPCWRTRSPMMMASLRRTGRWPVSMRTMICCDNGWAFLAEGDELVANFAAYSGLRWGELAALMVAQITPATCPVDLGVDRKSSKTGTCFLSLPSAANAAAQSASPYPSRTPE